MSECEGYCDGELQGRTGERVTQVQGADGPSLLERYCNLALSPSADSVDIPDVIVVCDCDIGRLGVQCVVPPVAVSTSIQ